MPDIAVPTQKLVRRFVAAAILAQFLLLTGWAFSLQGKNPVTPKAQKNGGRHQIDFLEEKWRNAILKNDVAALDSLLAEDYVGIMTNGTLQTKDQTLAGIRGGGWRITVLDVSDRKVRFYGRTALVTSLVQVEGANPEGNMTGTYRYTHVYARDNRGVWKIVNFEANRLGHPHHPAGPE
jgi:ketosteroid isomerase-like protein